MGDNGPHGRDHVAIAHAIKGIVCVPRLHPVLPRSIHGRDAPYSCALRPVDTLSVVLGNPLAPQALTFDVATRLVVLT